MNAHSIGRLVAAGGFLLLFPGFVFYHYAVSVNVIPPVIGGLFGPVTMGCLFLFLALLPMLSRNLFQASQWYVMTFLGFAAYVATITLANYAAFSYENVRLSAEQSLGAVVFWISIFFIGYLLPLESKRFLQINLVCALLILAFVVHYVATTGSVFFYARELYDAEEGVATYQGFARSALALWILLTVVARGEFYRWTMVLSGVFVLFVLGARSELYAYLALSVVLVIVIGMRSLKALVFATVASFVLVAAVIGNLDALTESRQLQILDLRSSTSWSARQNLEAEAWEVIKNNPIWGHFGAHALRGGIGDYAHNYLSAWENYGLIGVTLYLLLTFLALLSATHRCFLRPGPATRYWMMSFAVNLVCLVLVFVSKPVFWPLVALGWGLHVNAMAQTKRVEASKARAATAQPRRGLVVASIHHSRTYRPLSRVGEH